MIEGASTLLARFSWAQAFCAFCLCLNNYNTEDNSKAAFFPPFAAPQLEKKLMLISASAKGVVARFQPFGFISALWFQFNLKVSFQLLLKV